MDLISCPPKAMQREDRVLVSRFEKQGTRCDQADQLGKLRMCKQTWRVIINTMMNRKNAVLNGIRKAR
ncbi:hypothetical protein D3C78_1461480 [compost metagenome]